MAFWHNLDGSLVLPDQCFHGLLTACRNAKLKVTLYCYQEALSVPPGIVKVDARQFLREDMFQDLLQGGLRVQHIADYIRFRAIEASGAPSALFLDCDTLWFAPPPQPGPEYFGHVFGSMRASPFYRGSKETHARHWQLHYLKSPGDMLHLSVPYIFPPSSPVLKSIIEWMDLWVLKAKPARDYNAVMEALRGLITQWGLESSCRDPVIFCPLDAKDCRAAMVSKSLKAHTVEKILSESVCVQALWQSSRMTDDDAGVVARGSFANLADDSFWQQLVAVASSRARQEDCLASETVKRRRHIKKEADPDAELTHPLPWPEDPTWVPCGPSTVPFSQTQLHREHHLESKLGAGTYGEVFRAKVFGKPTRVAIKIVRARSLSDLVNTAELFYLARCSHNNVVKCLDGWLSPWYLVIVMELYKASISEYSKSLPGRCMRGGTLHHAMGQVASGLAHMHSHRIVHRDLHS